MAVSPASPLRRGRVSFIMAPMHLPEKRTFPWTWALAYAFGCGGISFALITVILHAGEPEPKPDPEAAQFMLECAYEWGVASERCREILHGGLPPEEVDGEPGC